MKYIVNILMNNENEYVDGKKAAEMLGVHQRTLYLWDAKGLIETIRTSGNKRLYNIKKYIEKTKCSNNNICENLEELDKIYVM
jgi:hypothetical protein